MPRPTPEQSVDFIDRSLNWPRNPWLPLYRRDRDGYKKEFGVIHQADVANLQLNVPATRIRVFDTNLHDLRTYAYVDERGDTRIRLSDIPVSAAYDTPTALIADGWEID